MLGVVLVVSLVEQLDTGGEVLRLVPGVGVDAPAAGDQQAAARMTSASARRTAQPERAGSAGVRSSSERVLQHDGLLAVGPR